MTDTSAGVCSMNLCIVDSIVGFVGTSDLCVISINPLMEYVGLLTLYNTGMIYNIFQ